MFVAPIDKLSFPEFTGNLPFVVSICMAQSAGRVDRIEGKGTLNLRVRGGENLVIDAFPQVLIIAYFSPAATNLT